MGRRGAAIAAVLIGMGALLSGKGNGVKTETPGDIDRIETIEDLEAYIKYSPSFLPFFETLHHFTNALFVTATCDVGQGARSDSIFEGNRRRYISSSGFESGCIRLICEKTLSRGALEAAFEDALSTRVYLDDGSDISDSWYETRQKQHKTLPQRFGKLIEALPENPKYKIVENLKNKIVNFKAVIEAKPDAETFRIAFKEVVDAFISYQKNGDFTHEFLIAKVGDPDLDPDPSATI
jgi:hypothetical protein